MLSLAVLMHLDGPDDLRIAKATLAWGAFVATVDIGRHVGPSRNKVPLVAFVLDLVCDSVATLGRSARILRAHHFEVRIGIRRVVRLFLVED